MTIQAFQLERPDLVNKRRECLNGYLERFMKHGRTAWINRESSIIELFDFPALEFGGLWYLQCRQIAVFLKQEELTPSDLSATQIVETFRSIALRPNFKIVLRTLKDQIGQSNFGFDDQVALLREAWSTRLIKPRVKSVAPPLEYRSIHAFELENFKSIEHLKISIPRRRRLPRGNGASAQAPALLILGENATGKSSILEALALTLANHETLEAVARDFRDRGFALNTALLGAKQKMPARKATVTLSFQDSEDRMLKVNGDILMVTGVMQLPPVFAYGAFRQYLDVRAEHAPAGSIFNLFNSTRLLDNPEAWLQGLKKNDLSEVIRVLRIIFSVDSKFDFIRMDDELGCLVIVTNSEDKTHQGKTPLHLASSGYRSLLAMVCDILRGLMDRKINPYFQSLPTAQAVVLIDEVEAHLHPRWKIRVMSALREALPKVTFIATSHDPLCLRGMHKGEVLVMRRRVNVEDELSVKVECISDLPDVGKLTVEQLLTSDFFNLMNTDEPDTQLQLAQIADVLAEQEKGLSLNPAKKAALKKFKREILDVLPIGSTEAQRLVQKSVAKFLKKRDKAPGTKLKKLRKEYREEIIEILERF